MAVERVREGEPVAKVIEAYGFNRTTIYKWLKAPLQPGLGIRALRSTKGSGRPRTLTPRQESQVFRWVNGRDPRQYGLDFGLWTRAIVVELIAKKFGIELGVTAVGELLARLGLTPQKPLQRAYQRDPEAIDRWQKETFPALAKQAKAEGAEIFFWDESGFRADTVHGKTWDVRGQTPVVKRPGQRQSISAASAAATIRDVAQFTSDMTHTTICFLTTASAVVILGGCVTTPPAPPPTYASFSARSPCFPYSGRCFDATIDGQPVTVIADQARHESITAFARKVSHRIGSVYWERTQPVDGRRVFEVDIRPNALGRNVIGTPIEEAELIVFELDGQQLQSKTEQVARKDVRVNGQPVITQQETLTQDDLPPGRYILSIGYRGQEGRDTKRVFVTVR